MNTAASVCLRCPDAVALVPEDSDPAHDNEIRFYRCPACQRSYARKAGRGLTFRWGHPVSLALYRFRGEAGADQDFTVQSIANDLAKHRAPEAIDAIAREITQELEQPTQPVRDILDTPASEEACRELLRRVVAALPHAIRVHREAEHLASLTPTVRLTFLTTLAHSLTVYARGTYQPGTDDIAKPRALRSINEVQHRVTACLRDCVAGNCNESFLRSLANWVFDEPDTETRGLLQGAWLDARQRTGS
jgi:hypothetical protein